MLKTKISASNYDKLINNENQVFQYDHEFDFFVALINF